MVDSGRNFWQQAAGDKDRNYVEICLKWGVILNGPGRFGAWPECEDKLAVQKVSSKKRTDLRRFSEVMKDGDIVALRLGTDTCRAIGKITGGYEWDENFGDIDGWDLQHIRRVIWLWQSPSDEPKKFDIYTFKQGDTTQELTSEIVIDWINNDLALDFDREFAPPELPKRESKVEIDEISNFLFDEGVASESINLLVQEMAELTRIAKWYQRSDNPPSEHETVAYLVVPFLRALGWTPQRMAIEWNRVDVALFRQLERNNENLSVVVEAKKKDNSCLTAVSQAEGYAKTNDCKRLIVTDGIRYGVFDKEQETFKLHSYLNLTRLQREYTIYECMGAKEAILAMTPEKSTEL